MRENNDTNNTRVSQRSEILGERKKCAWPKRIASIRYLLINYVGTRNQLNIIIYKQYEDNYIKIRAQKNVSEVYVFKKKLP